jgi:predicted DNA-binding transcriptional regulator AlpA
MRNKNENDFEVLLTSKQLKDWLQIDFSTIEKWVQARKIPFIKLSPKCLRFSKKQIEDWLANRAFSPFPKPLSLIEKEGRHKF